jgi:hypothetical protein
MTLLPPGVKAQLAFGHIDSTAYSSGRRPSTAGGTLMLNSARLSMTPWSQDRP